MARKFPLNKLSFGRVFRTVGPPAGTVVLSIAILSTALWIRHREQAVKLDVSAIAPVVSLGRTNTQSDSNQTVTVPHVHVKSSQKKTSQSKPAHKTGGSHGSTSSSKSHSNGTSSKKPGSPSTAPADVGFSPVTGGTVTTLKNGTRPAGTEVSSTVAELGTHPTTTWTAKTIPGPGGVSLTVPQNMSPTSLLVLPIQHGVLWLQVQQTQIGPTGTLGPALSDSTLWYTPYPASGSQPLTTGAESLGVIPATSTNPAAIQSAEPSGTAFSVTTPPSFWYAPPANTGSAPGTTSGTSTSSTNNTSVTTQGAQNTSPSGSTSSNTTSGTSSTSGSTASNSTGGNTTNASVSSATAYLYPSGLYQTAQGAVIALEAVSSSATTTTADWLYEWNDTTLQLTPIVSLWNGAGTYAWFAVGSDVVYFGSRTVTPPSATRFSGHQYLYDTNKQTLTPIRLGTWTSEAYTNGNQLVFDERNSTTWASFTPSGQP